VSTDFPQFAWTGSEQTIAELIFGLNALGALAYCIFVAQRERKLWPLYVFIAAALVVFYEPFCNVLGHVAWAEINQHTVFTLFGRDVPLAVCLIYMFYFGAPVTWLMLRMQAGVTSGQLWRYYGIGVLVAAAFEPLLCNGNIGIQWWLYYGDNQPLAFTGLPMYWPFISATCVFATAAVFHLMRRYLFDGDDRKAWLFIPVGPLVTWAVHGSASAPVFAALSSGWSEVGTTITCLMTIAFSIGWMWLFARLVSVDEPVPAVSSPAFSSTRAREPATLR
jgi:hypothetical protein